MEKVPSTANLFASLKTNDIITAECDIENDIFQIKFPNNKVVV
jgi:hypothetical protein